jgi:NAD(P)-dependent dehydrogenase (short-subunit alcohol dehydrogenase family)
MKLYRAGAESKYGNGNTNGDGPVAVVTGARIGGISFAIVVKLLLAGYKVVMGDRDRAAGICAAKELRRSGFKDVWFTHTDFSDTLQVGAMMESIRRKFGKLNLLINTSGSAGNPLEDNLANMTSHALLQLFQDNVLTFYNMTRAAVTQFMQHQPTGGVVVAFSTNNGILGIRGQMAYGALKQSLVSLCGSLTTAYGRRGIRFLVVSPGVVLTESANWQRRLKINGDWPLLEGGLNPSGRMVTPEDVAKIVVDICGDGWSMVTGTEIVIDGGERAAGGDLFQSLDVNDYRASAVDLARRLIEVQTATKAA